MEIIQQLMWLLSHTADFLKAFITDHGPLVYLLMFAIVFAETGLVITPFLPGDSLLFAAGTLAAFTPPGATQTMLSVQIVVVVFILAAFAGDNVNYWFGHYFGPRVMKGDGKILKRSYLDMTQAYFDRYGARTVIVARFVPIVRTFAPFMAGVGRMKYSRFITFSLAGSVAWVGVFVGIGFFFAKIPFVQEHYEWALFAVLLFSMIPGAYEVIRHRMEARKKARETVEAAIDEIAATPADHDA
jgi:membrane-associated protein